MDGKGSAMDGKAFATDGKGNICPSVYGESLLRDVTLAVSCQTVVGKLWRPMTYWLSWRVWMVIEQLFQPCGVSAVGKARL